MTQRQRLKDRPQSDDALLANQRRQFSQIWYPTSTSNRKSRLGRSKNRDPAVALKWRVIETNNWSSSRSNL